MPEEKNNSLLELDKKTKLTSFLINDNIEHKKLSVKNIKFHFM